MKSASDSVQPRANKWRLKRTLKRKVDFRPIEAEDVKYAYAAYKKGSLSSMGSTFLDGLMSPDEFKEAFEAWVLQNYHAAWTLFASTKKGLIPIGIVFASAAPATPYLIVNGMVWFPWATKRNIIEAIVNFLHGVRKEIQLVFYASPEHKRVYEVCAMHGVVRRVGTSYVAVPGKPAAVFETRAE